MVDQQYLRDDLVRRIAARKAVAIVGAGLSIAASGLDPDSVASWTGLLRHGVRRCATVVPGIPADWIQRRLADLASGDIEDILSVAEQVATRLGYPKGGEFARWLRESVGTLKPADKDLIQAIADLGIPIITTNYDSLIEQVTV